MDTELHYNNSPLIEAVLDIRVVLPETITPDALAGVRVGQETTYPTEQRQFEDQIEVAIGDEVTTAGTSPQTGFRFMSADERHVVQVRKDGFTFSR